MTKEKRRSFNVVTRLKISCVLDMPHAFSSLTSNLFVRAGQPDLSRSHLVSEKSGDGLEDKQREKRKRRWLCTSIVSSRSPLM